jgi:hypothetical protein
LSERLIAARDENQSGSFLKNSLLCSSLALDEKSFMTLGRSLTLRPVDVKVLIIFGSLTSSKHLQWTRRDGGAELLVGAAS